MHARQGGSLEVLIFYVSDRQSTRPVYELYLLLVHIPRVMEGSRKQSLDAVEVYMVDAQLPIINMGVACYTHNVIILFLPCIQKLCIVY